MRRVEPSVRVIARPELDTRELRRYLDEVGADPEWTATRRAMGDETTDAQTLVEVGGRLCYRSWERGLNPNVTRIREDQAEYLENILRSGHGSVLEHANFTLVFHNVSRVLTHELVRHRAGVGVSQESMRFVRLTDLPFWFPDWAWKDAELMEQVLPVMAKLEWLQGWMAGHFGLDDKAMPFHRKKMYTSFMRRFAPHGVATGIMVTGNVRAWRHVIEARTAPGAEEEIRLVFGKVAELLREEAPALFGDFEDRLDGTWVPQWSKV